MKTALQELIYFLQNEPFFSSTQYPLDIIIKKSKELLPKEKEIIMDAFVAGDERGTGEIPFNCEQYYQQTFNNQ